MKSWIKKNKKLLLPLVLVLLLSFPAFAFADSVAKEADLTTQNELVAQVADQAQAITQEQMTAVVEETTAATQGAPEQRKLSLQQAIDLGLANNEQIALSALSVGSAEITLKQAQSASKQIEDAMEQSSYVRPNKTNYNIWKILPQQAQEALDFAKVRQTFTQNSIRYGIEATYYGLQKCDKALEVDIAALNRAQTQYNNALASYKQGVVAKMDVLAAQAGYLSAQATYNTAKSTRDITQMRLNQLLGIDLDTPLLLISEFTFKEGQSINLDAELVKAQTTDITFCTAQMTYDLTKLQAEFDMRFSLENTYTYRQADLDLKEAQINYAHAKSTLEITVRSAYAGYETAIANCGTLEKSRDLAKEAYRLAGLQYQAGLATIYDVQNAEASYLQAELGYLNAIQNYNLCKAQFAEGVFPSE